MFDLVLDFTIWFDMDGCLARWAQVPVEETKKPGYYLGRELQDELLATLLWFRGHGFDHFLRRLVTLVLS